MKLKKWIQDVQIKRCEKKYDHAVYLLKTPYKQWICKNEGPKSDRAIEDDPAKLCAMSGEVQGISYYVMPMEQFGEFFPETDIIIVASEDGRLAEQGIACICDTFVKKEDCHFVYGDEDHESVFGRIAPWFKPGYSPDTIMDHFYIGNLFAFRRNAYEELIRIYSDHIANSKDYSKDYSKDLVGLARAYDFVLRAWELESNVIHVNKILYHNYLTLEKMEQFLEDEEEMEISAMEQAVTNKMVLPGQDASFDWVKSEAFTRRGLSGKIAADSHGFRHVVYDNKKEDMISIIIPSKDNVETLRTCIESVKNKSSFNNYEILVVDNGSTGYHRALITAMSRELSFTYIYQPMEFNFSTMCNLGASQANGKYLLLLNDDVVMVQEDSLERMLGQASLPHVGAVGAKLLYPDGEHIQHVGITNLEVGPSHKLVACSDKVSYYYGRNRMTFNMIGVTAACLMIKKDKYFLVGGLHEELKVAYNDVDFCFRLWEKGLYHVQKNDVTFLHFESMSRGQDIQDDSKWNRLLTEKEKLYALHETLRKKDPFYNDHLSGNSSLYGCRFYYPHEEKNYQVPITMESGSCPDEWKNDCLRIHMDQMELERKADLNDSVQGYLISGWTYVQGMNNARYSYEFLFREENSGTIYHIEALRYMRKDLTEALPAESNVLLAGVTIRIRKDALPQGRYRVGILAKDHCSRQRLINWEERFLENNFLEKTE